MSDTLLGDGFKVTNKTDVDVARKLPTDNYNRGRVPKSSWWGGS